MKYVWLAFLIFISMSLQATNQLFQRVFPCSNETLCSKAEKLLKTAQVKYHEAALRMRSNDPSAGLWFEAAQRSACRAMHMLLHAQVHGCATCIHQAVEGVRIVERICEKRTALDHTYTAPQCLKALCNGVLLVSEANRTGGALSAELLYQHSEQLYEEGVQLKDVLEHTDASKYFVETCEVAMRLEISAAEIALQSADMGHKEGIQLAEKAMDNCYELGRIFFARHDPEEYGISELFAEMIEVFVSS